MEDGVGYWGSLHAGNAFIGWLETPRKLRVWQKFCFTVKVLESGVFCHMAIHSPLSPLSIGASCTRLRAVSIVTFVKALEFKLEQTRK